MGGACGTYGGEEKCYMVLVENPGKKKSLGRHIHRCENNIKMEHTERRWEDVHWTDLTQGRNKWRADVISVMNFPLP